MARSISASHGESRTPNQWEGRELIPIERHFLLPDDTVFLDREGIRGSDGTVDSGTDGLNMHGDRRRSLFLQKERVDNRLALNPRNRQCRGKKGDIA